MVGSLSATVNPTNGTNSKRLSNYPPEVKHQVAHSTDGTSTSTTPASNIHSSNATNGSGMASGSGNSKMSTRKPILRNLLHRFSTVGRHSGGTGGGQVVGRTQARGRSVSGSAISDSKGSSYAGSGVVGKDKGKKKGKDIKLQELKSTKLSSSSSSPSNPLPRLSTGTESQEIMLRDSMDLSMNEDGYGYTGRSRSFISHADTDASIRPIRPSSHRHRDREDASPSSHGADLENNSRSHSNLQNRSRRGSSSLSRSIDSDDSASGSESMRSAVASTKPTTVWSIESNGANRIATVAHASNVQTQNLNQIANGQSNGAVGGMGGSRTRDSLSSTSTAEEVGSLLGIVHAPSSSVYRPREGGHSHTASYSSTSSPGYLLTSTSTHTSQLAPSGSSGQSPESLLSPSASPSSPTPMGSNTHWTGAPSSPSFPSPLRSSVLSSHSQSISTSTASSNYNYNVPTYTNPDPSRNPHPANPPNDNASTFTLASSTAPERGERGEREAWSAWGRVRADEDASVRALPPSRRESGESMRSKWSAFVPSTPNPASNIATGSMMNGGTSVSGGRVGGSPVERRSGLREEWMAEGTQRSEADEVKRSVLERDLKKQLEENGAIESESVASVPMADDTDGTVGGESMKDGVSRGGRVDNEFQTPTRPHANLAQSPPSFPPMPLSESPDIRPEIFTTQNISPTMDVRRAGSVTPPASVRAGVILGEDETRNADGRYMNKGKGKATDSNDGEGDINFLDGGKKDGQEMSMYSMDTFESAAEGFAASIGGGGYHTPRGESPELKV